MPDTPGTTQPRTGGPLGNSAAARMERERRREQVAELTLAHQSQRRIAEIVGVAVSTVGSDQEIIRRRHAERAAQSYEQLVAEETAKLDVIEARLLPTVLRVDPLKGMNLWALDRWLGLADRRARLLGLDRPVRPAPLHVQVDGKVKHEHTDARSLAGTLDALGQSGILDRIAAVLRSNGDREVVNAEGHVVHDPGSNGEATPIPLP